MTEGATVKEMLKNRIKVATARQSSPSIPHQKTGKHDKISLHKK
jgi:hypothetical protein